LGLALSDAQSSSLSGRRGRGEFGEPGAWATGAPQGWACACGRRVELFCLLLARCRIRLKHGFGTGGAWYGN